MKLICLRAGFAITLTAFLVLTCTWCQTASRDLRSAVADPSSDARPMVRWWWFGPAVTKPEILRELQQMKADGIGGAELAFVYPLALDDPSHGIKNLSFLSPEMLDMVHYAASKGRELGLRVDLTLCSGWPYGGPHIPLALSARRLRVYEVEVPARTTVVSLPVVGDGERFISASLADGQPHRWDVRTAKLISANLPAGSTQLTIPAADHPRVALFFYSGYTHQMVKRAAAGAEGFVLDPFSHLAVATHLKAVGEPLLSSFGSQPPYAIFSDSLEAYGADWTFDMPTQFAKRRGYDLLPHLPEFVAGGTPEAEKVRHDYGLTLTELINENYLLQINDWAKEHHTRFRSQTYGEPAVSFSSQRLVALPEGEGPQWRAFSTLRWATSANHVFGNNISSGETFTWLHSPVFRATPLDMKAEADIDFLTGENLLIFHGWPYSPPASMLPKGDPGWSLYAAAVFNDHNPWHPVMPAVTAYIARVSHFLRLGEPANQVALVLPIDDAWAGFSPGKVSVTDAMQNLVPRQLMDTILSAGYNVDFIDADAINSVGLGTHEILVLPPIERIPPATLAKLALWMKTGGHVITVGRSPTFDPEGNPLSASTAGLLQEAVHVDDAVSLKQIMPSIVVPDFALKTDDPALTRTIGFIRRKLPHSDVYFVSNTSNRPARFIASFATTHRNGEMIDPDSGITTGTSSQNASFDLAPYESRVLVFSDDNSPKNHAASQPKLLADISSNWHVTFPALNKTTNEIKLRDWTADPVTLHYSGEAIYTREVVVDGAWLVAHKRILLGITGGQALPGDPNAPWHNEEHRVLGPDGMPNPLVTSTGPGMHAFYDPPLHEAALVLVNNKRGGALWHPPYQLDITSLLHAGTNRIELHVYNTAINAWSGIPPRDYGSLKAKYGDRLQMQDLDKVKPVPSGILGSIQLLEQEVQ